MDRRAFVRAMAGGLLAAPLAAGAQPVSGPARIAWISTEPQPDPFLDGFREGLRQHGYVDGQNVILELRWGNVDALRGAAAELLRLKVAFIVAAGPAVRAVRTMPSIGVLFAISGDPVEGGLADSLSRPGRNFSGITFLSLEVAAKRIQLLKEALPRLRTLAALSNIDHPGEPSERRATEDAARALGIALVYVPFNTAAEFDQGLRAVRDARPDAMVVFPDGVTVANRAKIAQYALAERLPSMFGWSEYAVAGGLMSYGANVRDAYVHLAGYADRLLRGAKPADLPIVQPTKFELVINLKTAKALGLTLPPSLLQRADRVIG